MTSTPATAVRKHRNGWLALGVTVVARATLTVLISLLGWSMAPALLGWHPTVVMTGSMMPHLVPGDVVVSRPIDPTQLRIGQVLLVDSPDQPGELRMHRLVRISSDGELILRGDANPNDDSTPVARSAVHGVGALRIPKLGLPYLWAATGQTGPLAVTGLALALLITLARWWRPAPAAVVAETAAEREADDQTHGETDEPVGQADDEPHDEPTPRTATGAARPRLPASGVAVAAGGASLWRRCLVVAVTVAVLLAVTAGGADAVAPYSGTTGTANDTWLASTYFTCANAVKGDSALIAYPMSESSGTSASDISGNNTAGTYSGTITYGVTGPCTHDSRTAVTFNGTNSRLAVGGTPPSGTLSFEIWFKTSGTHGGVLLAMTNNGGTPKVDLAMTTSGTLTFANGTSSVTTTAAYNNNVWHLAVVTVGSGGTALYVDTASPVTSSTAASVASASTYYIGYGGTGGSVASGIAAYFQGSVGFASTYSTVLTQAQVTAHYRAAN